MPPAYSKSSLQYANSAQYRVTYIKQFPSKIINIECNIKYARVSSKQLQNNNFDSVL